MSKVLLAFLLSSFSINTHALDYFEAPPRVTVASLGPEAEARYAATGKIQCKLLNGGQSGFGSAQLTYKHDLITTSGHALIDIWGPDSRCVSLSKATDCRFIIKSHGATRSIEVVKLEGTGISCPLGTWPDNDWAVMRLKEPIDDVKPYSVDRVKSEGLVIGSQVVTIGHSIDFQSPNPRQFTGPKHYGLCSVLAVDFGPPAATLRTACGCSFGCSGGSLLSLDPNPVLLGIVTASFENYEHGGFGSECEAGERGKPDVVHFEKNRYGTDYRTLSGDFLSTLLNAGKTSRY